MVVYLELVAALLAVALLSTAMVFERRMHRHRRPGVSYAQATFRLDGGWRRAELFTDEGLRLQRHAARFGMLGMIALVLAVALWIVVRS